MSRGKPLQEGVRVKLPAGANWDQLASMSPRKSVTRTFFPGDSIRCRIQTIQKAEWFFPSLKSTRSRSRKRVTSPASTLDFDLPDHFLPEFPAPIF